MGENKKSVKVVVEATGNEFTLATGELVAKTRDVLLDRRRSDLAATTWGAMSEKDQRDELGRYASFAEELVHSIVEVVAAGNFDVIHAQLDNFKSKDGEVTVTAKGRSSDGALIALNRIGHKQLKIIVADQEQFDKHRDDVPIDADQPEMFDDDNDQHANDEDEDNDLVDPETGEIIDRDDTTQAIIDAVEDDVDDGDPEDRLRHAKQAGAGAFDEHGDPDKNPYNKDDEDDSKLHAAWFNGFYERKNELDKQETAEGADDDEDPYNSGYFAAEKGLERMAPFEDGSEDAVEWLDGYDRYSDDDDDADE